MKAKHVTDLVGNTPLVRLPRLAENTKATVLVKLEGQNPGGSSKDRIALAMVRDAEATGNLRPGARIIEATSGNTGIGLALVGAATGHPVTLVVSSAVSQEKRAILLALGAELIEADWDLHPDSADSARSIAEQLIREDPAAWRPSQYDNPLNPQAHYGGTGPEIWHDTNHTVTHVVASIGTGGTISGTARFLKEASAGQVQVIGADPEGSTYSGLPPGAIVVDGVGSRWTPDLWPSTYSPELVDRLVTVDNTRVYRTVRELAHREGLLVGPSAGLTVAAALDVAGDAPPHAVVVAIAPDRGANYLTKAYSDNWLHEQGVKR